MPLSKNSNYAQWFREASPYIRLHRGKTFVIALSSATIQSEHFHIIAQDIQLLHNLGIRILVVHGARKHIDDILQQESITTHIHLGHRITDHQTLEI